ncbi:MAG: hypothetical protein AAGK77_07485 [Pseudomonadota bacterium]
MSYSDVATEERASTQKSTDVWTAFFVFGAARQWRYGHYTGNDPDAADDT